MEILINIFYPMLCVFLPCIIYEIFLVKKEKNISKKHFIGIFIFVFYLYLCIDVAGIGTVWQIGTHKTIIRMDEINFIPFSSEGILTYILNVIMFIPLGFLLPLIWKSERKISNIFKVSLWFSFLIEFCQLFNFRTTDIDDLMMNTLGGILGFFIWKIWIKIFPNNRSKEYKFFEKEANCLIILAIMGRFFFYNWNLLINFL